MAIVVSAVCAHIARSLSADVASVYSVNMYVHRNTPCVPWGVSRDITESQQSLAARRGERERGRGRLMQYSCAGLEEYGKYLI